MSQYRPKPDAGGATEAGAKTNSQLMSARKIWLATREKIENDIKKLQSSLAATYKGHDDAQDIAEAFAARVEPVLGNLDESLAHKLNEITHSDEADRAKLVAEARAIITSYERFIDADDIIYHLDRNPLVPLAIRATLDTSLESLNNALG